MIRDTFEFMQDNDGRHDGNESARADDIDIDVVLHFETRDAILVSIDGSEVRASWLPKSQIEIERTPGLVPGTKRNGSKIQLAHVVVTMKAKLATEKGLA